jgi:hypothetical protein
MLLIDLNEPHHPHHDQLLNLTHTTSDVRNGVGSYGDASLSYSS